MNNVEDYVINLHNRLRDFSVSNKIEFERKNVFFVFLKNVGVVFRSGIDMLSLIVRLKYNKDKTLNIVYTGLGLCIKVNDKYRDRLVENLVKDNVIYINRDKDSIISSVNGNRSYNIGGIVKLLNWWMKWVAKRQLSTFYAYRSVNDFILSMTKEPSVYSLCYYNLNGLSLVFSKYRGSFNLIEVQHGGIINYPTYSQVSTVKIADSFYVKNQITAAYLKEHLCLNFPEVKYYLLSYPKANTQFADGVHIMYASTIEFNGLHPIFMTYLREVKDSRITVYIRLHPRERHKKSEFEMQTKDVNVKIVFDDSINWLEANRVSNLIVVSPWSSVIEDASDNGYKTIIIDEVGRKRFEYMIDNESVFYVKDAKGLERAIATIQTVE